MTGYICGPRVYQYKGWTFELHSYSGPWPVKKNGDLKKLAGRKFWRMFDEFRSLSKNEQNACLIIGGGCVPFE